MPISSNSPSLFEGIDPPAELEDLNVISFRSIDEIEKSIVESPFRAIFQYNNFFLPQLRSTVDKEKTVNLRPEYQRRAVWTNKQKSLLIESILLNIPVPPVFLFEYDFAAYEVMDGQQRILAINSFFDGDFSLTGLSVLAPLNGLTYKQLPPRTRRSLERGSLSAIVLIKESRSSVRDANTNRVLELRKFVFERLNTGGRKLNAQELRNAVYTGDFNDLIIRLSANEMFTSVWSIPAWDPSAGDRYESADLKANPLYKTMTDCEIVLRYFALRQDKYIKGSMRSILDGCMERHLGIRPADLGALQHDFLTRLELAIELFGQTPFRLTQAEGARPTISMYEAVMVALDRLWGQRDQLRQRRPAVNEAYWRMLEGADDFAKFTGRANTAKDTRARIQLVVSAFRHAIEA